jgi:hypothetical protein
MMTSLSAEESLSEMLQLQIMGDIGTHFDKNRLPVPVHRPLY